MKHATILAAVTMAATLPFAKGDTLETGNRDILETLQSSGRFEVLCSALTVYGLDETLKGTGPTTLFAPSDEAFKKLPRGTVEELLRPENKDRLFDILAFHITFDHVSSGSIASLKNSDMTNGSFKKSGQGNDAPFLSGTMLTQTDIACTNGVIHVIDTVLMPPAKSQPNLNHGEKLSATCVNPVYEIRSFIHSIAPLFTDWAKIDAMIDRQSRHLH